MAREQIAPTKNNLFKTKEKLFIAEEGFDLLEQKRVLLVMELMHRIEQVKLLERELDDHIKAAYPSLKRMLVITGREKAEKLSQNINYDFDLTKKTVLAAGIRLPGLEARIPKAELKYSPVNSYAECDETVKEFLDALKIITELAAIRKICWKLAHELHKTQRRVNALEKIVIPTAKETKAYIETFLEEKDRDNIYISKLLKKKGVSTKL